jgi:hypothetical protein
VGDITVITVGDITVITVGDITVGDITVIIVGDITVIIVGDITVITHSFKCSLTAKNVQVFDFTQLVTQRYSCILYFMQCGEAVEFKQHCPLPIWPLTLFQRVLATTNFWS